MVVIVNSHCFPKQCQVVGLCTGDVMYFLRATKLKCIYCKKFSFKWLLTCTGCMIENNVLERILKNTSFAVEGLNKFKVTLIRVTGAPTRIRTKHF
jgi:hypothetical protein